MVSKYVLKNGPSREQLFDCIRLGPTTPELRVLDFWGENKTDKYTSGASLPIEIEGLHKAGNDGRDWFFWGRRKQITSGDKWVPMWESKYMDFAFGRWNTYHRTGFIQFADTSFFTHPVQIEEEPVVQDLKKLNYTLRELPLGRYKTTLCSDQGRSARLEIQPYGGNLRVRFLGGHHVKCGDRLVENSRWTILSGRPEEYVEDLLRCALRIAD